MAFGMVLEHFERPATNVVDVVHLPGRVVQEGDGCGENEQVVMIGRAAQERARGYPIVSFLQLAADMAVSTGVPDGHGHYYGADFANAWAAILQLPGWTTGDTERLRAILIELDTAP